MALCHLLLARHVPFPGATASPVPQGGRIPPLATSSPPVGTGAALPRC